MRICQRCGVKCEDAHKHIVVGCILEDGHVFVDVSDSTVDRIKHYQEWGYDSTRISQYLWVAKPIVETVMHHV